MGYQESLVKLDCLAEAAGMLRAFSEYRNPFFRMDGVERAAKDVSLDWPSEIGDFFNLPRIGMTTGDLFAVVVGDRHPYQCCSGRWRYIDGIADKVGKNYSDYLQPVNDDIVVSSWSDNPTLAERSYQIWKGYFMGIESLWDNDNVDFRPLFPDVVYGIGVEPPQRLGIDPDPVYVLAAQMCALGCEPPMLNVNPESAMKKAALAVDTSSWWQ